MKRTLYIPEETATKIKETAVLEEVVADYIQLKRSGASRVGDCPSCGAKKRLNVTPSKKIWKCFSCDIGGKDAVSFLMKTQGKTFPESLHLLADRYGIQIEQPLENGKKKIKKVSRKSRFRDMQLRESGILVGSQHYWLEEGNDAKKKKDRYQAASLDRLGNVIPGDDMVLHYLDLEGKPLLYKDDRGKARSLVRVRWANPSLHLDRNGNPIKYQSPKGSGSHLWLPNGVIKAYKTGEIIETLYITEGEKKADKMTQHGMMTVGVMGISNFALGNDMPYLFELLIKRCGVAQVVFILDADWQDLSLKNPDMPVDQRPTTFFRAVTRFRDYFRAYLISGIELDIFFAYGKDLAHKGIDDLLVFSLRKKENELKEDFEKAILDREGKGEHVNCHRITTISEYKLKEFWHLHSRPAFFKQHGEQLRQLHEFKYGRMKWRWNEEDVQFEMADKIRPHEQYWRKIYDGEDKLGRDKWRYTFNYSNVFEFLKNRGFGLYEIDEFNERMVKVEGRVVEEVSSKSIRKYVVEFTRNLDEPDVLELILRGGKQYVGPDKLSDMYPVNFQFNESDKDTMFLYFKNVFWKITKDEISEHPIGELPRHIWRDRLIDFEAKYVGKPLMTVRRQKDNWQLKSTEEGEKCDIANFYARTSMFHWRKLFQLVTDKEGNESWQLRPEEEMEKPTLDEFKIFQSNFVAKMCAAGYLLHDYTDWGNMKAVICMDGLESEVGKSQGGTGKGVFCSQFEKLCPVHWVNGKRKNLEEDKHLYAGVDERTQVIYFEDVRVNFDFEQLFPGITRGTWVEKKGVDGHKEAPKKHLIDTNHGLSGEGNSFWRRQFLISFSDYYNKQRRVSDDFGYQLFEEWDQEQWNLFYNWMATCCQVFLQHRLNYTVPQESLERRNLRQRIGENFLDWASLMFDEKEGPLRNAKIEKVWACEKYLEQYPADRRYVNVKKFKTKLQQYARYADLEFNPGMNGTDKRIKSNGKEFFVLGDGKYDATKCWTILSNEDLARRTQPESI